MGRARPCPAVCQKYHFIFGESGKTFHKLHTPTLAAMSGPRSGNEGLMAFAFSSMYSKWARGAHSNSQGIQFGAWLGLLIGGGSGIIDYATANILGLKGTAVNAVVYIVFFAVMGLLASLIYSKVKTTEAS